MLPELLFFYFATAITVLSLLVVTRRNPVHSVLWMLLLFFHIAGLYITLNAELMAAVQVIVYAGAILVLFLFVVLLLDLKKEIGDEPYVDGWPLGIALALALFLAIGFMVHSFEAAAPGEYSIEKIQSLTHSVAVGEKLYTEFLFPFEVVSMVLLVAVVGAIVLAKRKLKG